MQVCGAITPVNTIAERLKQAREALGLSQLEVAIAAGVKQGTIGNIEAGLRSRPRELLAIAAAVKVSPQWLLTGKEHGPSSAALIPADLAKRLGNLTAAQRERTIAVLRAAIDAVEDIPSSEPASSGAHGKRLHAA